MTKIQTPTIELLDKIAVLEKKQLQKQYFHKKK